MKKIEKLYGKQEMAKYLSDTISLKSVPHVYAIGKSFFKISQYPNRFKLFNEKNRIESLPTIFHYFTASQD